MGPRATKTQAHEPQGSLDPRSSINRVDPGRIPTNEISGFPLNYPVVKTPNLTAIPTNGPNYPPSDSIRITRGLGGYTRRVRSRAPSGESKYPPGDSAPITRGLGGYTHRVHSRAPSTKSKYPPGNSIQITRVLGGYCRGPNTGVPNEVELITIKR